MSPFSIPTSQNPPPVSPRADSAMRHQGPDESAQLAEDQQARGGIVGVAVDIWPIMLMQFLCLLACVVCFPFFTYVPSAGQLGDSLPKVSSQSVAGVF